MNTDFTTMLDDITNTTAEPQDYTGEDGLLYCGKCHKAKEAYFPEGMKLFGRDRHPAECDQRAAREEREAAEQRRKHLDTVENLKRRGFTDTTMRKWNFENDNGRNPQTDTARSYVARWEEMKEKNYGLLFWGRVGTGKSYLAGCIANALMEQEIPVCMTNFALILNDLAATLEQVYNVIDSRYRSEKPLIITTNLSLDELNNPPDTAHKRIYDRVIEMCTPVCCTGENFRREKAQAKMKQMKELLAERSRL